MFNQTWGYRVPSTKRSESSLDTVNIIKLKNMMDPKMVPCKTDMSICTSTARKYSMLFTSTFCLRLEK